MAKDKVEGEGSYSGTKDYNERTRKFIDSGKVEEAADEASRKPSRKPTRCRRPSASASRRQRSRNPSYFARSDPHRLSSRA